MDGELIRVLGEMNQRLVEIATALQAMSATDGDAGPNYYRNLEDFPNFDWSSIGADVVQMDPYGVARVRYQEREFKRRTHPKYGKEIWFSRGAGRDEEGNVQYVRLITFSEDDADVEPLPEKITDTIRHRVSGNRSAAAPVRSVRPTAPVADDDPDGFDATFPRDDAPAPVDTAPPATAAESEGAIDVNTFWTRYYAYERAGKLAKGARSKPPLVEAIAAQDWQRAWHEMHGLMRI